MAVIDIKKIRIIALKKDKKNILNCLQKREIVEIIETNSELTKKTFYSDKIDYDYAGTKFAIDFLTRFSDEKISLKDKIAGKKINIKEEDFSNFLDSYSYRDKISKAQDIEMSLNEVSNKINNAKSDIDILIPWKPLDNNPLEKETINIKLFFGVISEKKYITLIQRLNKFKLVNTRVINRIGKDIYLEVLFKKDEKEIEQILEQEEFQQKDLPFSGISPREAISKLESIIKEKELLRESTKKEAQELAKDLSKLRIVFDILATQKNQIEADLKIYETDKTFSLVGWVEDRFLGKLITELKETSDAIHIETLKIGDDEEKPVLIENTSFWSPFEAVTNIYGLPRYNEIDPTSVLAPFFILFFALSLTDAGYGIILMILSFLAIKVLKVPKSTHKMVRLLGYGGFVTFIMGALFGGWFGIDTRLLPSLFSSIQLINPVEEPLTVLMLSLLLGIFQVIFGISVSFYWKTKHNKFKEAILDDGVWILFLIAICLFGALQTGLISNFYASLIMIFFWISLLSVIFSKGRHQSNPFLKVLTGVGGLYALIGYFSDVLSYSRLLALGLATGIIAMVINMIAGIAKEMIPYFGSIIALLILIGGHTFNIGINTLGSFIHAGRLQFVEFFPKFMDGGGRRFDPLKRNLKFVEVIDN